MSNSSDHQFYNKDLEETPSKGPSGRWSFLQQELENAIHSWDQLESTQQRLSPDEEQLEKIKGLIGQLKSKLEQF